MPRQRTRIDKSSDVDWPDSNDATHQKYRGSQGTASSIRSMTRSTVASQFSIGSTSSKSMGRRIMGSFKSIRRKRERKRSHNGSTIEMDPVPETVKTARRNRLSDKLARSAERISETQDEITTSCNVHSLIHVVLFLIDANATKFEILLLDFDNNRAYVRDVLTQIQFSAKDDLFRTQRFSGIADEDGCEMIDSRKLSAYTLDWVVAVAIPDGMTSTESAEIASPLFKDPRVNALLERYQRSKPLSTDDSPPATASNIIPPDSEALRSKKRFNSQSFFAARHALAAIFLVLALFLSKQLIRFSLEPSHVLS